MCGSVALVVGSQLSALITVTVTIIIIIIIIVNSLIINDIMPPVHLPTPATLAFPPKSWKTWIYEISLTLFYIIELSSMIIVYGSWRYYWILYKMTPEVIRNKYRHVPLFEDQFRSQSVKITDKIVFILCTGPCLVSESQRQYS